MWEMFIMMIIFTYISAVKQIASKIKVFVYIICVLCIFIMYKYTHMHVYISEK